MTDEQTTLKHGRELLDNANKSSVFGDYSFVKVPPQILTALCDELEAAEKQLLMAEQVIKTVKDKPKSGKCHRLAIQYLATYKEKRE